MIKTLQNTQKQDKMKFKVPKSVQDAIPIHRIWSDGIFQFGSKFSKTIRFSDNQLSYITNVPAGRGLMKCGSAIVPFEDSFPKQTRLYGLITTKPSEISV